MKKRTWISLLCCLLILCCTGCGTVSAQSDVAVRVGDVFYDLQTVQNTLTASCMFYETTGMSLSDAQIQQLTDNVPEHLIGLGVPENLLREAGQADVDGQIDAFLPDIGFTPDAIYQALEALVSRHRSNYEIESHPEWLTVFN